MEASFEQLEVEEVDSNDESMCWLLDEWETCSYEKKKQVFDRFFEETETKIERHGYGSRDDILKDCEILKTLLLKIDDFKKRIKVDCLKVQLKYHRAMRGKAKIELILCDIFNTYKDYMFEEHKVWMMEKNIHVMTRDDISELICNFGRSVGTYKYALRQCGAEVLKEPKEKVQMKNSSVIQVIERNREEYMLLEKKIGCLLIEMYKASEPYKPGGQVKHTLHGYIREAHRILGLLWDELKALGNPGYAQPPDARQQGYCSHIAALPPTPHIAPVQPPTLAGIGNQQLNILASFPPQGSVQTSYGVQPGPSSLAQVGYGCRQGNNAAYHQVPNLSSTRTDSIQPAPMQL